MYKNEKWGASNPLKNGGWGIYMSGAAARTGG